MYIAGIGNMYDPLVDCRQAICRREARMRYLSVAEIARLWGISARGVRNYCVQGRVPGAFLTGKTWSIPADARKPARLNGRR